MFNCVARWMAAIFAFGGSASCKQVGRVRMQIKTWVGDRCVPTVACGIHLEIDLPARFRILAPKVFRVGRNPPLAAFYCVRHPDSAGELQWVSKREIVLQGVTYTLKEAPLLTTDRYIEFKVRDE